MSHSKNSGTIEQAVQGVVTIATTTMDQCQSFVTKTYPTYVEYFERLRTFIVGLFTVYILGFFERVYNLVVYSVNVLKNLASNYVAFVKGVISYPFTVAGRIYNWAVDTLKNWISKIKHVQEQAQGSVKTVTNQAKVGYDEFKNGNVTILSVWRNVLDSGIDFLNGWLKNADDTNHVAKLITDWNVISYLKYAKFEQKQLPVDHSNVNEH